MPRVEDKWEIPEYMQSMCIRSTHLQIPLRYIYETCLAEHRARGDEEADFPVESTFTRALDRLVARTEGQIEEIYKKSGVSFLKTSTVSMKLSEDQLGQLDPLPDDCAKFVEDNAKIGDALVEEIDNLRKTESPLEGFPGKDPLAVRATAIAQLSNAHTAKMAAARAFLEARMRLTRERVALRLEQQDERDEREARERNREAEARSRSRSKVPVAATASVLPPREGAIIRISMPSKQAPLPEPDVPI